MPPRRIHIIGITGTGKTFLAQHLSRLLHIPRYDLDDLFWKKKYYLQRDAKQRNARLRALVRKERWIIEGVYDDWIKPSLRRADLVLWIDAPIHVVVWRILKRYLQRKIRGTTKESFNDALTLIRWAAQYKKPGMRKNLQSYQHLLRPYHKKVIRLSSKRAVRRFLRTFYR